MDCPQWDESNVCCQIATNPDEPKEYLNLLDYEGINCFLEKVNDVTDYKNCPIFNE